MKKQKIDYILPASYSSPVTRNFLYYSIEDKDININQQKGIMITIPTIMKIYKNNLILFFDVSYIKNKEVLLSETFVEQHLSCPGAYHSASMDEQYNFNRLNFDLVMDVDIAFTSFDSKSEAMKFKLSC